MKSLTFTLIKYIYYIFLFLILTGSNIYLGPITAKYVLGLILFLLVLIHDNGIVMDKCFRIYCIFIVFFFLSSLACGYLSNFIVTFLNYYFIAYVGWRATNIMIQRNVDSAKYIIYLILGIGLFDVIVTLSQMTFNVAWYTPIESFFQFKVDEDIEEYAQYKTYLTIPLTGVFGNAVKNGWYLAVCSVLSTIFIFKYKKVVLYVLPLFFLIGTFACQERSALAAAIIMLGVISLRLFNNFSFAKKVLLTIAIIAGVIYLGNYLINFSQVNGLRYTELGLDDTGRSDILEGFFSYLASNPILPNYYELIDHGGRPPHNILFNAFVYGGIASFIAIVSVLIIQAKSCVKIYFSPVFKDNYVVLITICAFAVFTINSFFHNQSIVTGELMPWLLWSIIYRINQNNNIKI